MSPPRRLQQPITPTQREADISGDGLFLCNRCGKFIAHRFLELVWLDAALAVPRVERRMLVVQQRQQLADPRHVVHALPTQNDRTLVKGTSFELTDYSAYLSA